MSYTLSDQQVVDLHLLVERQIAANNFELYDELKGVLAWDATTFSHALSSPEHDVQLAYLMMQ